MKTNYFDELKQYKQDLIDAGIDEKFHRRYISTVMSIGTWFKPKVEVRGHRNHLHQTLLEKVSNAEYDYDVYRAIGDLNLTESIAAMISKSVASFGIYFLGQFFVADARPAFQGDISGLVTFLAGVPLLMGVAKSVREATRAYSINLDCIADNDGQNPVGGR